MYPSFDESDPRYLIALPPEGEHDHVEEYRTWLTKWSQQLDSAESKFGVILVNHVHDHDHDDEDDDDHDHERERDPEAENAISAMLTQFRRDHRDRINQQSTGYVSVWPAPLTPEVAERFRERVAQFSAYMFGVRGTMTQTLEEAKAWLDEVADLPPLELERFSAEASPTKTAIFYGSTTGATELVAENVQATWERLYGEKLPVVNVGDSAELMSLFSYDSLLVGVPTWNVGKLQDDWEIVYPYLDQIDLTGKTIAIFGIGDQHNYPENFQDAVGILGRKLRERGAELVGFTSVEGYEHSYSVGVEGDQFMGLAIDEVNQPELTDERIERWLVQVKEAFVKVTV